MNLSIESRVSTTLAIRRYLRAAEKFNEASKEFVGSCKDLRKKLENKERFVVQIDFKWYIVESDQDGNFDIQPVDSL